MTLDDIRQLENLNEEMIKEYCRLAEERLKDCLDTKKQLEQKAFVLLSGYITISLALFGLIISGKLPYIFGLSSLILCIGICFILLTIKLSNYGNLGRHPEDFLGKRNYNYLTIDKKYQALMYAYNLEYLVDAINISKKSNTDKRLKINLAIYCGAIALVPFLIKFLFSLFCPC
jgi:hypothetical protein